MASSCSLSSFALFSRQPDIIGSPFNNESEIMKRATTLTMLAVLMLGGCANAPSQPAPEWVRPRMVIQAPLEIQAGMAEHHDAVTSVWTRQAARINAMQLERAVELNTVLRPVRYSYRKIDVNCRERTYFSHRPAEASWPPGRWHPELPYFDKARYGSLEAEVIKTVCPRSQEPHPPRPGNRL
jgi:hypothetical protein